jgi:putative aminopeptidase FrvX
MVAIDNASPAPGQNSTEVDLTVALKDSTGPFDYHLSHKLLGLARHHGLPHRRDVFVHYRCDAASAVEAGNDIRTALVCFGVDASHGYERTHRESLMAVAELVALYIRSEPAVERDRMELGPIKGFPDQHL